MKFKTIVADPPWPYKSPKALVGNGGKGNVDGSAEKIIQVNVNNHYDVMSIPQICELPVNDFVEDNAHLYLWTTNSFLCEAHEIARAWGFVPKTLITWAKCKKNSPEPSMKTGYWFRSASEHVLFCVRGKLRLRVNHGVPTWFPHERLPHSVKPDLFYNNVEEWSYESYLEMFARRPRNGWYVWGNEVDSNFMFKKND